MADRSSSHFLARLLTHERLLLALIVSYFVACMGLLWYLRHSAALSGHSLYFEELYIRVALSGLVVLIAAGLGTGHLMRRRQLATSGPLRTLPPLLPQQVDQDRIRLLWIVALSVAIFAVDVNVTMGPAIAIAYVTVVLIA